MSGNQFNISGKLVLTAQQAMTLPKLSAAPGSPVAGDMYYNTTSNKVQTYNGSAWQDVSTGSTSLTGQTLAQHDVLIGNASGLSAALDSSSVGDILADSTNGLTIKSGVITNSEINTSAGITLSKLAALSASKVLVSDGSGFISASSVTPTTLSYLDATSSIQTQLNGKLVSSDLAPYLKADGTVAIVGHLVPDAIGTRNLGSNALRFASIYSNIFEGNNISDTSGNTLYALGSNILFDKALNKQSVAIESRTLTDATGTVTAINWAARHLIDDSSNVIVDWSNATGLSLVPALNKNLSLNVSGTGIITVNSNKITAVANPIANQDAATKIYVDTAVSGAGAGTFIPLTQKGANSGVATLDAGGKVPLSQMPAGVFEFTGVWDPTTNTPTLSDSTIPQAGITYWVSVAKTTAVSGLAHASMVNFQVGDLVISNGTSWVLTTPAAGVSFVNGAQGSVTVNALNQLTGDVTTSAASGSQSLAATIAAGAVTSSKIAANTIVDSNINSSAAIAYSKLALSGSIVNADINTSAAIAYSKLAALSTGKVLQSNASTGFIEASAITNTTLSYLDATSSIQTQLNSKANLALSNLASVAINTDLLAATDNTISLGSSAKRFINGYFNNSVSIGSGSIQLVENAPVSYTLAASTSSYTTVATLFALSAQKSTQVMYEVTDGTDVRSGTIKVSSNGTVIGFYDSYAETSPIASLAFQVVVVSTNAVLQFTGTSTAACTMKIAQRNIL